MKFIVGILIFSSNSASAAAFTRPKRTNIMTMSSLASTAIEHPAIAIIEPLMERDLNAKLPAPETEYLTTHPLKVSAITLHPALEVEVKDGRVVLHSTIPSGFAVVDNDVFEGKKVVATRNFKKGDLLYIGSAALLDLSTVGHRYKLNIFSEDHNGNRCLLESHDNTDTHSVDDYAETSKNGTNRRQVYGWDSFMNHSCEANAYFPLLRRTPTEMQYQAFALRDIDAGDELTCDYALFDYDCNGHSIEVCACGSKKCRGKMLGFQALNLHEKVNILHLCEEEIKERFFTTEGVKVFRDSLPDGVGIVTSDDGAKSLVATHDIEVGDIIFKNEAKLIPRVDLESKKKHLLELDGTYHLLDNEHHFIHRDDYAEMLSFDSFMDHSCSPNTRQVYTGRENYVVYASKKISTGDKITCDYTALANEAVGVGNFGMTCFRCNCGEANCRGELVC